MKGTNYKNKEDKVKNNNENNKNSNSKRSNVIRLVGKRGDLSQSSYNTRELERYKNDPKQSCILILERIDDRHKELLDAIHTWIWRNKRNHRIIFESIRIKECSGNRFAETILLGLRKCKDLYISWKSNRFTQSKGESTKHDATKNSDNNCSAIASDDDNNNNDNHKRKKFEMDGIWMALHLGLMNNPTLHRLTLRRFPPLTDADLTFMKRALMLSHELTSIDLGGTSFAGTDTAIIGQAFRGCKNLKSLRLDHCHLDDFQIAELIYRVKDIRRLKTLSLCENSCRALGLYELSDWIQSNSIQLETLGLGNQFMFCDNNGGYDNINNAYNNKNNNNIINNINMRGARGGVGWYRSAAATTCSSLIMLQRFTVSQLFIALERNRSIQQLDLSWNQITDKDIGELLPVIQQNKTLKKINLRGNSITNVGMIKLAKCIYKQKTAIGNTIQTIQVNDNNNNGTKITNDNNNHDEDLVWNGVLAKLINQQSTNDDRILIDMVQTTANNMKTAPHNYNVQIGKHKIMFNSGTACPI